MREGGCAGCRVGDKMICTSADTGTIRPLTFLQLRTEIQTCNDSHII